MLAYIFFPVHRWLNKKLKRESLSAFIVTLSIVIVLLLPSVFILNAFSQEVFAGYITMKQNINSEGQEDCVSTACIAGAALNTLDPSPQVRDFLENNLSKLAAYVFNKISETILALPIFLLHAFIIFFVMYYLLKDGRWMVRKMKNILPVRKMHQEEFLERFNEVTFAVVFGNVIVALLQGVLASVGFFILGVESPLLWGLITMFVALIPLIGPFVIWIPLAIFMLVSGYLSGDTGSIIKGVGLIIYGVFIISSVDNIIKPKIISSRAQVHPALILLGVIGGLTVFGVVGIIIGPVILSLVDTAIDLFGREKKASFLRK